MGIHGLGRGDQVFLWWSSAIGSQTSANWFSLTHVRSGVPGAFVAYPET
jgi:hypothetical protein